MCYSLVFAAAAVSPAAQAVTAAGVPVHTAVGGEDVLGVAEVFAVE